MLMRLRLKSAADGLGPRPALAGEGGTIRELMAQSDIFKLTDVLLMSPSRPRAIGYAKVRKEHLHNTPFPLLASSGLAPLS